MKIRKWKKPTLAIRIKLLGIKKFLSTVEIRQFFALIPFSLHPTCFIFFQINFLFHCKLNFYPGKLHFSVRNNLNSWLILTESFVMTEPLY